MIDKVIVHPDQLELKIRGDGLSLLADEFEGGGMKQQAARISISENTAAEGRISTAKTAVQCNCNKAQSQSGCHSSYIGTESES